ncbi:MAG TPA: cytochrome c-type biogenesis protein CcmH [Candidatus Binatia bacterium]|nr:cytochrome c-type biogenesis protein CcmH [Candidatus Binatia bacterium]
MLPRLLLIIFWLFVVHPLWAAAAPDIDDQTRAIAQELRCVVCQNLSVADSPSEMAQQMRGIIREQLAAGKTSQQVKDFFVSKYGEWVLLAPTTQGFSLLVWVLPFVVLIAGVACGLWFIRRWSAKKSGDKGAVANSELLTRVRNEAASDKALAIDPEDSSPHAQLLQERARLYTELKELEFDYQAGKLAESDYTALKLEIENKAAGVLQHLDSLLSSQTLASQSVGRQTTDKKRSPNETRKTYREWQLAAGGVLLLLFGLTLGIALTNSLRPRESTEDSITGGFLTGTGGSESAQFLQAGKSAFAKQDWPKAIEAFKQALAADPNQPEAHAYMGFILIQAGHADGALLAFEKALSQTPNFPMALWGKGMVLLRDKQDYSSARQVLEKLAQLLPAGAERSEVEKVIQEMPQSEGKPRPQATTAAPSGQQITGRISIDPKLKGNVDSQATLFIIARSSDTAKGPPLAVKKIDRPVFPLSYSLGAENVMMQGVPFTGSVTITARLDKDGNPTTRQPGDLTGDYKKNPVAVGSKNIDIVLEQVVQ